MNKLDFEKAVDELLDKLGAVERKESKLCPYSVVDKLLLHTVAGPLRVRVFPGDERKPPQYQPFVAMQFEYPDLAEGVVSGSVNPYSGKWNFHPEKCDKAAVAELEDILSTILVWRPYNG